MTRPLLLATLITAGATAFAVLTTGAPASAPAMLAVWLLSAGVLALRGS